MALCTKIVARYDKQATVVGRLLTTLATFDLPWQQQTFSESRGIIGYRHFGDIRIKGDQFRQNIPICDRQTDRRARVRDAGKNVKNRSGNENLKTRFKKQAFRAFRTTIV